MSNQCAGFGTLEHRTRSRQHSQRSRKSFQLPQNMQRRAQSTSGPAPTGKLIAIKVALGDRRFCMPDAERWWRTSWWHLATQLVACQSLLGKMDKDGDQLVSFSEFDGFLREVGLHGDKGAVAAFRPVWKSSSELGLGKTPRRWRGAPEI